jgi:REP element-mobilizing transposase RayT
MPYNPEIHHRRSIRIKRYDYSQTGLYFVTICIQNRQCILGEITNGEMILSDAGEMIKKWYMELSYKFYDIVSDTYIIMPNHFHAIIINNGGCNVVVGADLVGADLSVCPDEFCEHNNILGEHGKNELGEHIGSPLRTVIQWFKTMTTNEYIRGVKTLGWQPFDKKFWQRNYYEHIIRDEQSYKNIINYIINNPANWKEDKFYIK